MDLSRYIPQIHQPRPQLYTGGQPEPSAWPELAKAGITTVVNLRPAAELPGRDEAGEVRSAGLTYINVPISGADTLGHAEIEKVWHALKYSAGTVLVHCGTGNRCGAVLALTEAWHRDRNAEDAIAFGRQAGLTALEPAVRAILA
jgi:uncharacterized protein (TIGR01244 family)